MIWRIFAFWPLAASLAFADLPRHFPLANGTMTGDGTRSFVYDAENRLTNVNVAGSWKVEFAYDGLGRRRIERDYTWTGGNWLRTNETRYLLDGYLVTQERDSNNAVQVTYTRGTDLSGSRQRAGGIGGLLARTDAKGSTFYHADGNGNITALIDGNQNIVARYEYDPFGRLIGKWGTMADVNRYRFSSKEVHPNSGLYYYGYRFYEPNLQRWLNRDPSGERGGINLYRFARNNSLSFGDPDGRGLLSFIFGEGWSGEGADAFEESIGESMMEQGAEMKAGLDVLRDDGLGASRNYLVDDMSDRYADMMLNYGEGSMYAIAANDMTGGTSLMEAIYGIDLQSQCELGKQDRWQRRLMGGGQMGLTAAFSLSLRNGGTPPPRVFYVTPDGVVLPPGPKYLIPPQLVQNPYRAGSYGMIENGKFVETLRIDPATPTGFIGPEYSHYHLDGGKTHFSPRPGQPDPGFH